MARLNSARLGPGGMSCGSLGVAWARFDRSWFGWARFGSIRPGWAGSLRRGARRSAFKSAVRASPSRPAPLCRSAGNRSVSFSVLAKAKLGTEPQPAIVMWNYTGVLRAIPRGTEPVHPSTTDAGRGRLNRLPKELPLTLDWSPQTGAFPACRSSFVSRWLLLRRRPPPSELPPAPAPGSWLLLPAPGLEMLRRCAPGSPVPGPLRQALPPSATALRHRLRQCAEKIPEAEAVLDLLEKCPEHQKKGDFPVIVFEGLDATGKTTVTEAVKDNLNGILLRSPPPCISQWRTVFDDEPTPIKRAFYAAGNYILASEIAKASTQAPVIIDRYWHSTAAYTIATETNGKAKDLPPAHDEVYQWPEDLLKPDLVLLLTVDPEERVQRLQRWGLEKTKEEAELEANSLFRQRVEESYRRMVSPACQVVDASPSKEEVLKTVLQLINKHFAL
ncbi:UMP-CMP kinase 2, mitochondrial [Neopelma chrysocephalum]|uniref:UMP-CMP kinase 2, mitochondrial n=1 Tax=Neopelma chrysocephalum TaxID=114329 RepID=UPI000FCD4727|nr:UMP-CMP kinase 2, mitochondrial [Neopelma chrysocephalum]